MEQQHDKDKTLLRIILGGFLVVILSGVILIVMAAITVGALEELIGGVAKFGIVVVALAFVLVLALRASADPIEKIGNTQVKLQQEKNSHIEHMALRGWLMNDRLYRDIRGDVEPLQIDAPIAPQVDPRHALLVSLCLMTIRAEGYGPASKRLLSCDDAQDISSNRGGQFAKRDSWDAASKYGQEIGWLYTQIGGPAQEQGLKIKLENGGCTVTDLLDALHQRNLIRDSAINALPTIAR